MQDANGSRFELLLGAADWGRCTFLDADAQARALGDAWRDPAQRATAPLRFDEDAQSLALARRVPRFRAAPSDRQPAESQRLGAAADAHGSVYWIADAGSRIDVRSSGSMRTSVYAPALMPPGPQAPAPGEFAPLRAADPPSAPRLQGLAVTTGHYLVAGLATAHGGVAGLRVYDLLAGGPPLDLQWPPAWPLAVHDLAPRPCSGLAVLDRTHRRVWLLDRRLGMQGAPTPQAGDGADGFAPPGEPAAPPDAATPTQQAPCFELVVNAAGGNDPIAIDVLADGTVLVLDGAGADGHALVSLYVGGTITGRASAGVAAHLLGQGDDGVPLRGHDAVLLPRAAGLPARLAIVTQEGNQCVVFDLHRPQAEPSAGLVLDPVEVFLPLRRYDGLDLVRHVQDAATLSTPQDTGVLYHGGGTWLPLVAQERPRHLPHAVLYTPVFDGNASGCVWHRLVVDGCVPPGCAVRVATRAADDPHALDHAPWQEEPAPVLRADGSELPWLADGPGARTDATRGRGSWELLFQRAQGRWLQLRLTLSGDELSTPRLFALRAWHPRFSYASRYLPTVYREDETSADFLERFLANFEGLYTQIEDRIATAHALFDVRTAPADTLDWLAGWLGLVLDPALTPPRKRLLIRHALTLYQYRGTTQGLRLAAELVLSDGVSPHTLTLPGPSQHQPYGVRIIEHFLTRRLPRALLGETVVDAPRLVPDAERWSPAEGADGLHQRYRAARERAGLAVTEDTMFRPLPPMGEADVAVWQDVCRTELGGVPGLAGALHASWGVYLASLVPAQRLGMGPDLPTNWPSDPQQQALWKAFLAALAPDLRRWLRRWQGFLARRHRRVSRHAAAWGQLWPAFHLVPAPDTLPTATQALAEWALFENRLEPMAQTAHRFSVRLPSSGPLADPAALARRMDWARRVVALEKPAHTVFDVGPYWAMFRMGQARLGLDSLLGQGSRAPELAPYLVLGRAQLGAGRVAAAPAVPADRLRLAC